MTRPGMEHLDAAVAALGTTDGGIPTVVDVAGYLPARERAIAAHALQTSPFEGLPDQLRRAFLAADHLRCVVPPSPGGPQETCLLPTRERPAVRLIDPEQRRHRHTSHCWWRVDRGRWACEPGPTH